MKAIPNLISIFRICLVPVFVATYFSGVSDARIYAAVIYAIAALSDFLDGYLARKFNASSNLGKVLDPLGDKMMNIAVMVCITIDGLIPIPLVVVAGVKEILMGIGGVIIHRKARLEIPPSNIIGKVSTVVFFVVFLTLMLFTGIPDNLRIALVSAAMVMMAFALASYISTFIMVMKKREGK